MFRSAFKGNRCIIPASGYFEWKTMPDGKQPYFISAADGGVLSIADLWDPWHSTDTGETVLSCTMIVTDANAFTRAVGRLGCGCCVSFRLLRTWSRERSARSDSSDDGSRVF
jgi:SOS response associated peptidase (SRAP)